MSVIFKPKVLNWCITLRLDDADGDWVLDEGLDDAGCSGPLLERGLHDVFGDGLLLEEGLDNVISDRLLHEG